MPRSPSGSIKLKRAVQAVPTSSRRIVFRHPKRGARALRLTLPTNVGHEFIDKLFNGTDMSALLAYAGGDSRASEAIKSFVERLGQLGFLSMPCAPPDRLSADRLERFDRLIGYFEIFERRDASRYAYLERLERAHVLFLGVGSLASWAILHMASCGVGNMTLVDYDKVESSNLSRQALFSHRDIGRTKVEAAKRAIERLTEYTRVKATDLRVSSPDDILGLLEPRVDLVILTADKPTWKISVWGARASLLSGVPLLRGNRLGIGPLTIPGETACPACDWPRLTDEIPNAEEIIESYHNWKLPDGAALSTTIGLQGTLLAHEALAYLTGAGVVSSRDAQIKTDLDSPTKVTTAVFPRDPRCPVCAQS